MNHSNALHSTCHRLTDGYLSYTFGPRNAEIYIAHLLNTNTASIRTIHRTNAFYTLNRPPFYIPPAFSLYGLDAWLLDVVVRSAGSVVPQQLWFPQCQVDRLRFAEEAALRMPVFFVNMNGNVGVPVMNAAVGDVHLLHASLPPQLADKTTAKIRISWPGYAPSKQQVPLRDQTTAKNPITFERLVKHVGRRVGQYLLDCERIPVQGPPSNWIVGHGNITAEEVMLIGLVHFTEGSWMPILQLVRRVVR